LPFSETTVFDTHCFMDNKSLGTSMRACIIPVAVRKLAHTVGGLPLALMMLGGYLSTPERSRFPELIGPAVAELSDPKLRLQLAQPRLGTIAKPEMTLREIVTMSLEGLPYNVAAAFYALGSFAPQPEQFDKEAALAVTRADLSGNWLVAALPQLAAGHRRRLCGMVLSGPGSPGSARGHSGRTGPMCNNCLLNSQVSSGSAFYYPKQCSFRAWKVLPSPSGNSRDK
jgi:hypothetical protein